MASDSQSLIEETKAAVENHFKLKDMGTLRKYTLELLQEYSQLATKPSSIPIEVNHYKVHDTQYLLSDPFVYIKLVGQLMYLTLIRPDITYVVHLNAYTDSDWASCKETKKYLTRFCIFIGDSLVSWRSEKQSTVSRSYAEAKYRAMASTTSEIMWLLYLLKDFGIDHT
ncbi:uncharacterized mitochondrial protein AtMg00810-like [Ricinus communis]|uniref:uncharacterized mitochondrial protein AtMg00810-like n=1 Tax=Ricinus communis TaxID=3988 RepID=UPI00201AB98D|nr:uncharacterized mitochondrial protein AtMg00810-like [Ricinus communis]